MSGFTDAFYKDATARFKEKVIASPPSCASAPLPPAHAADGRDLASDYITGESPSTWFEASEVWEIRGAELTARSASSRPILVNVLQSRPHGGSGGGARRERACPSLSTVPADPTRQIDGGGFNLRTVREPLPLLTSHCLKVLDLFRSQANRLAPRQAANEANKDANIEDVESCNSD
eukprot:753616-Hanusia_phi.AAC.2